MIRRTVLAIPALAAAPLPREAPANIKPGPASYSSRKKSLAEAVAARKAMSVRCL